MQNTGGIIPEPENTPLGVRVRLRRRQPRTNDGSETLRRRRIRLVFGPITPRDGPCQAGATRVLAWSKPRGRPCTRGGVPLLRRRSSRLLAAGPAGPSMSRTRKLTTRSLRIPRVAPAATGMQNPSEFPTSARSPPADLGPDRMPRAGPPPQPVETTPCFPKGGREHGSTALSNAPKTAGLSPLTETGKFPFTEPAVVVVSRSSSADSASSAH